MSIAGVRAVSHHTIDHSLTPTALPITSVAGLATFCTTMTCLTDGCRDQLCQTVHIQRFGQPAIQPLMLQGGHLGFI